MAYVNRFYADEALFQAVRNYHQDWRLDMHQWSNADSAEVEWDDSGAGEIKLTLSFRYPPNTMQTLMAQADAFTHPGQASE